MADGCLAWQAMQCQQRHRRRARRRAEGANRDRHPRHASQASPRQRDRSGTHPPARPRAACRTQTAERWVIGMRSNCFSVHPRARQGNRPRTPDNHQQEGQRQAQAQNQNTTTRQQPPVKASRAPRHERPVQGVATHRQHAGKKSPKRRSVAHALPRDRCPRLRPENGKLSRRRTKPAPACDDHGSAMEAIHATGLRRAAPLRRGRRRTIPGGVGEGMRRALCGWRRLASDNASAKHRLTQASG